MHEPSFILVLSSQFDPIHILNLLDPFPQLHPFLETRFSRSRAPAWERDYYLRQEGLITKSYYISNSH